MKRLYRLFLCLAFVVLFPAASPAATTPSPPPAAPAGAPANYDAFVRDATVLPGLITVLRKDGKVYLVLQKSQLAKDFVETSVPATGLGGFGPAPGEPYVAPARIMRFERVDNTVVIRWPNTFARVSAGNPAMISATASLPSSVVAVAPVVAESPSLVAIPAAPFLGDVADFAAQFDAIAPNPAHAYRLDPSRSFFLEAKAFPQNTVLRVSQTWASADPDTIDNAPDPRSIEVKMTYNFIAAPNDGYMPRIADPRVGYFEQPLIDFQNDLSSTRNVYYLSRWNFMPEHPGMTSQAKNPLVFTLSNDVPVAYRDTVRNALLTWNAAFARIGILNAVQVVQQPDDPSFDVDDIRHNMVSWFDAPIPQYGAEALVITDPRTGEEINAGINVDAVEGLNGRAYRYVVAPARGLPDGESLERAFTLREIRAVVLHESGHDLGLQHNFIGSMAYTARELQDTSFTSTHGVASSVMEYAPINLWPKGTPQGNYEQLVLGPYDYYAVHFGYGYVANASTPEAEVRTLNGWASRWSDPMYRFASDEDAFFDNGHAIDPRVQQDDLTNHPLAWEQTQLTMLHGIMNSVNQRFPRQGQAYDEARRAFLDASEVLHALCRHAGARHRRRIRLARECGRSARFDAAPARLTRRRIPSVAHPAERAVLGCCVALQSARAASADLQRGEFARSERYVGVRPDAAPRRRRRRYRGGDAGARARRTLRAADALAHRHPFDEIRSRENHDADGSLRLDARRDIRRHRRRQTHAGGRRAAQRASELCQTASEALDRSGAGNAAGCSGAGAASAGTPR